MHPHSKENIKAIKECLITRWIPAMFDDRGMLPKDAPDCQLCMLHAGYPHYCEKCPVFRRTGIDNCEGSPYVKWIDAPNIHERRKAAEEEVDFLLSLLPRGETVEYDGHIYSWSKN